MSNYIPIFTFFENNFKVHNNINSIIKSTHLEGGIKGRKKAVKNGM